MKRLLTLAVAAVMASAFAPAVGTADDAAPVVYAHRGGALVAPENTLGAFHNAHDTWGGQGVWIELDAQLTSDGHLVVIHDATLDRTTDCEGNVIDHTLAEVQACDATVLWPDWPAEGVPTLEEVFTEGQTAGWRLMVELKNIPGEANFELDGAEAATELVRLVDETGFPVDDLLVQSFFPTSLDRVKEQNPGIDVALLTTSTLPGSPVTGLGFTVTENATFSRLRGYEVSAPEHRSLDMSAEAVAFAHTLGRDVVVWTPNDADRIDALEAMGVDGIITDDPALAFDG